MTWRYQYVSEMLGAYRRAFATLNSDPSARIRMFWSSRPLDLAGFRREFVNAMHRRINLKVAPAPKWRKMSSDWQISAWRDSRRLRGIHNRICVYQFETDEAHRRFGDRLSRYDD